ncbi:MAG: DUF5615 family PIN-like protein [Planctomycetia bacterium]
MRFKTDENLPAEISELLKQGGHDAVRVDEQGLAGADDSGIAAVCQVEKRAIVTLDTDFMDVRRFPPEKYSGIVVLRLRRQTVFGLVSITKRLIPLFEVEPLEGRLWIIDENRVRIRPEDP